MEQRPHGRTFWDLIAENPKKTSALFLCLIIVLCFSLCNGYSLKTQLFSFEKERTDMKFYVDSILKSNKKRSATSVFTEQSPIKISQNSKKENIKITSNYQSGGQTAHTINNNIKVEPTQRVLNDATNSIY